MNEDESFFESDVVQQELTDIQETYSSANATCDPTGNPRSSMSADALTCIMLSGSKRAKNSFKCFGNCPPQDLPLNLTNDVPKLSMTNASWYPKLPLRTVQTPSLIHLEHSNQSLLFVEMLVLGEGVTADKDIGGDFCFLAVLLLPFGCVSGLAGVLVLVVDAGRFLELFSRSC